jgi:hypothetical protein
LCVLLDIPGFPGPACLAAVYLGTFGGRSLVRVIDREVVDLVNRAFRRRGSTRISMPRAFLRIGASAHRRIDRGAVRLFLGDRMAEQEGAWRLRPLDTEARQRAWAMSPGAFDAEYEIELVDQVPGRPPPNLKVYPTYGQETEYSLTYLPILTAERLSPPSRVRVSWPDRRRLPPERAYAPRRGPKRMGDPGGPDRSDGERSRSRRSRSAPRRATCA